MSDGNSSSGTTSSSSSSSSGDSDAHADEENWRLFLEDDFSEHETEDDISDWTVSCNSRQESYKDKNSRPYCTFCILHMILTTL